MRRFHGILEDGEILSTGNKFDYSSTLPFNDFRNDGVGNVSYHFDPDTDFEEPLDFLNIYINESRFNDCTKTQFLDFPPVIDFPYIKGMIIQLDSLKNIICNGQSNPSDQDQYNVLTTEAYELISWYFNIVLNGTEDEPENLSLIAQHEELIENVRHINDNYELYRIKRLVFQDNINQAIADLDDFLIRPDCKDENDQVFQELKYILHTFNGVNLSDLSDQSIEQLRLLRDTDILKISKFFLNSLLSIYDIEPYVDLYQSDNAINEQGASGREQMLTQKLVYPNPTSDLTNFKLDESTTIIIYNLQGETKGSWNVDEDQKLQLDITTWSDGMYFYTDQQKNQMGKFLKI